MGDITGVIDAALARIDQRDRQLQALVGEEDRRGRLVREGRELAAGPLEGMLVGSKDIFHVAGLETRAGSALPPQVLTGLEAVCVTALKRAGALVLGKTVTTEFAYFAPGPTTNPHHPGHTPGGSSSGSAAAVAAGYCPLALGSQTVGSVIRPAAFCGVVGFKPSYGRVDATGVIYYSPAVDTVGWFARDVEGVSRVAEVLCADWRGIGAGRRPVLGVPEGPYLEQASPAGLAAFREQVRKLEAAGYVVQRVAALGEIDQINERHTRLIAGEVARQHAVWFAEYEARYRQRTAELIRWGQGIDEAEIAAGRAGRGALREQLQALMERDGIDLWICPSALGAAPEGLDSTGDPALNLPWTHAGLPVLGLPVGRAANGLPLGLQCAAGWHCDEVLLGWGRMLAEVFE